MNINNDSLDFNPFNLINNNDKVHKLSMSANRNKRSILAKP